MTFKGIAISGKSCSGKDTLADELEKLLSNTRKFALSTAIKDYAEMTTGTILEKPYDDKTRRFIISLGQAYREYNENYWIDLLDEEIEAATGIFPIVTDIRQQNEFDHYYTQGYLMVRLECDHNIRVARGANLTNMAHETELALDKEKRFHLWLDSSYHKVSELSTTVIQILKHVNFKR